MALHEKTSANNVLYLLLQELFPKTEVKPYPDWVFAIIILLSAVPVIPIPLVALYHLIKRSSARADLNPSSNEGFEIEPRDQQNPRAPQVESRH